MKHTGRTLAAFLLTLALALGLMPGMNLAAPAKAASGSDSDINTPLTLDAKTAGTIIIKNPKVGMKYRINGGTKTAVNATDFITINVTAGNKVQFFGKGAEIIQYSNGGPLTQIAGGTAQCYIYGNIMSLVDENGFSTAKELKAPWAFAYLFKSNGNLYNHSKRKLVLPATTLTEYCYYDMFDGCESLEAAPDLPAESLALGCYGYMFAVCPLTAAPRLDARTLAASCYYGMFGYCEELTAAPVLPAPKLENGCYDHMFTGCKKLKAVTCLATDVNTNNYPIKWLKGVATSGTFIKAPAMNSWPTGDNGIPNGWTAIPSLILKQGEAEAKTLDLTTGSTATLTAVVAPGGATDREVSWRSSDDGIATVVDGLVTAVAAGSATITATSTVESAFSASCVVTVPSTYIITIPATLDVYKAGWNDSEGISASGSLAAGKKLTVTASSDGEFALVNTSDNAEKIRYKLVDVASEDAEYYMTSEKTVWEFTTLWEDAETQSMGVVVEDYSTAAPGSEYIDTVTFTASVVDAQ